MKPEEYRSYRDLPPVAGVATMDEAMRIGLSIEDCVRRLKRHHWAFRRLHEIFIKHIADEPVYELKMGFSLHAYYCVEHAAAWRRRVAEMREPPLGLDAVPHAALEMFFDEILAAPHTEALLVGIYEHAVPALRDALQRHLAETNRLVDHPSCRICRFALIEVEEMASYGAQCAARMVAPRHRAELAPWAALLGRLLARAGGLDGAAAEEGGALPPRQFSAKPHVFARQPRRDERFPDPYNMGVHAEVFLYDEKMPLEPKTLMMYYKRLREIDVPEMMASILAEISGKPWEYTVDMTRQLWDEARHAMMGEVGFVRAGIDWGKYVRVNSTWSLALNTQLNPLERHAVLYFIEQGLMPKTGKRFEWEVGVASGDPFSAMAQDYDWADEVLHARIGRDWYVKEIGDARKAIDYGDKCWSSVMIDWRSYREKGLTRHENWWPALYLEWCRVQGKTPEPRVLAYHTTYEAARADLQAIERFGVVMPKRAVLLANLGSPDSTSVADVRRYLREFLGDKRVLDMPAVARWLLLEGVILRTRPKRSARAYAKIWTRDGSPLVATSRSVRQKLAAVLGPGTEVYLAMRYGRPSIASVVAQIAADGVDELLVFPQYPHYAMASWETVVMRIRAEVEKQAPRLRVTWEKPFFADPDYIGALLAVSADGLAQPHDHVLFSYHGLPVSHLRKTDPLGTHCTRMPDCCLRPSPVHGTCYRAQILATTGAFAKRAGLEPGRYSVSFQSRLAGEPWLEPFTDLELKRLPGAGVKRLLVLCPAFMVDCLETLEEIAIAGRRTFLDAGGAWFHQIPCLNDQPPAIDFLAGRVRRWLADCNSAAR